MLTRARPAWASFSAVLLAGGKSTRMGTDKALLPVPGSELLLWQRQLRLLQDLDPEEILWSGPPRPGLPGSARIVEDQIPNAGPLAGISVSLEAMRSELLVVLAIDLPQMTAVFFQRMLQRCAPDLGIVARRKEFFEPLAAIYPKSVCSIAREHLDSGRYALQDVVQKAVAERFVQTFELSEDEFRFFKNWNTPDA